MKYCITMERTLMLAVDFEAENDDEACALAEQIYLGTEAGEFESGSEQFDYALNDTKTGRTLVDWD